MQINTKGRTLIAAVAGIGSMAVLASSSKAQVITAWNFENDAIAVNNNPAPSTGTGTITPIGMNVYGTPNVGVTAADVVLGVSGDTGTNANADTGQIFRVRAAAGPGGAANGWSSLAPIGTQGAVFAASTAGFTNITVGFDWYATTQGEANLQLEYTTNGTTFTNVPITLGASDGPATILTGSDSNTTSGSYINGGTAGQNWFPGLTATITDPAAANNPLFAIEMVNASTGADDLSIKGGALNNNSGNWRFDNVTINGTAAVPEPASFGLLALGAMGLAGRRRRASR